MMDYSDVEADIVARLAEVARTIDGDPSMQTEFIRGAYAVLITEMHGLGYLEDASFLLFMRAIHPEYYLELLLHDEAAQKMYLRCEYENRAFNAHRDLFPSRVSSDDVSHHGERL